MTKPWTRHRSGMPLVMLQASGPGRIAFSHDAPGELIALPLQQGAAVDVREHVLLAATLGVTYDWAETGVWFVAAPEQKEDQAGGVKLLKMGLELAGATSGDGRDRDRNRNDQPTWHYPVGQYIDRFHAGDKPGLVLVQVSGNAYVRDLAAGESILVKPPALLFKDPTRGDAVTCRVPRCGRKTVADMGQPLPLVEGVRSRAGRDPVLL